VPNGQGLFQSKGNRLIDRIKAAENANLANIEDIQDRAIFEIPIEWIQINKQVRTCFDNNKIKDLADNIKNHGLLHPIIVAKDAKIASRFNLIIGENRLRAHQLLGLHKIKCIVKDIDSEHIDTKLLQISENIKRNDLNPIELADALMLLKNSYNITLNELADKVGFSVQHIKRFSRIHKIPHTQKQRHIKNGSTLREILKSINIDSKGLTVRPLEKKEDQLTLFSFSDSKIALKPVALNFKKDTKENIQFKIDQCEQFIIEAKNRLSTL
jgi:ParB family transcriptional regulator, chromosome partitioning protein